MDSADSTLSEIKAQVNRALAGDYSADPLGVALLVSICLKYGYEPEQLRLVEDSLEHWAEEVVRKGSRQSRGDRDITAAAFVIGRRRQGNQVVGDGLAQDCLELVRSYWRSDSGFFCSFAYTCLIADFLSRHFPQASVTNDTLALIENQSAQAESLFNDPANLSCLLISDAAMSRTKIHVQVREFCETQMSSAAMEYHKSVAVALALWRDRRHLPRKFNHELRGLADLCLRTQAAAGHSIPESLDVVEEFGKLATTNSPMLLSVSFALGCEVLDGTVRVSPFEFERSSWFARCGAGIFGWAVVLTFVFLGIYSGLKYKSLRYPNGFQTFFEIRGVTLQSAGMVFLDFLLVAVGAAILGIGVWFGWGVFEQGTLRGVDKWAFVWGEMKKNAKPFIISLVLMVASTWLSLLIGG